MKNVFDKYVIKQLGVRCIQHALVFIILWQTVANKMLALHLGTQVNIGKEERQQFLQQAAETEKKRAVCCRRTS